MPDSRELHANAVSTSSNASPDDLEEAMWRLKVQDNNNQEGGDAYSNPYPDRPGAPDCIYYLRTGLCGYGSNCRYNHPTYNAQGTQDRGELPERVGQPDCQYFLKTGTCKFGATCKYHHPQDRHDSRPISLNILGLPMRQDEKSCPYYMRTGTCKFGIVCKFNHPQPATMGAMFPVTGPAAYGHTGSSLSSPSSLPLMGGLSAWPLARPPYLSSPRMQGLPAYMPVILPPSQGTMPVQQGWSTYTGTVSNLPSTDVLGPTPLSNTKLHAQSGSSTMANLPERPDQPECQYFMKTGNCKYGTTCKYHHPKERNSATSVTIGPLGLPLRPGQPVCTFYSMYGTCRYGSACKYDHPLVGYYNYTLPALSILDPSTLFPQRNSPNVTWTSATSATETSLAKQSKTDEVNSQEVHDSSDDNHERGGNTPAQTTSQTSHTASSLDSQQNHSD